jgi:hypothetical protein
MEKDCSLIHYEFKQMHTSPNKPIASESTNFFSYENFLKKISALPAVQQMVIEKAERDKSEILQSRRTCLKNLKVLRLEEAEAKAKLDAAEAAFKKAEASLEQHRSPVVAASIAYSELSRKVQYLNRDLIQTHGESSVQFTLYVLANILNNCKEQIAIIGESLNPAIRDGDGWTFRPIDPALKKNLEVHKKKLESLEKIYAEAQFLIEADLSPDEINVHCTALLNLAGYKKPTIEASDQSA